MMKVFLNMKLIQILVLLVYTTTVVAQPSQSVFSFYTSLDGLVHNNILDIYTDSRGFVWICTWNGISRFDGYRFKNYCNDPDNLPVQHNRFVSVKEDANGHLWFSTYDGHLYRLNRFAEQFENVAKLVPSLSDKSYRVGNVLFCSRTGGVWVEYQGGGVVHFLGKEDASSLKVNDYIGNREIGVDINYMNEGSDGTVWLVCDEKEIVSISNEGKIERRFESNQPIITVVTTKGGIVYATRNAVILRFFKPDSSYLQPIELASGDITALALAIDGSELYVGTAQNGIRILKMDTGSFEESKTTGTIPWHIQNLVVDSHNTVWITNSKPGIIRFDPLKKNYKLFKQKLNTVDYFSDTLSIVQEHNDVVWLKMRQAGFGYYDRAKDTVEPFYNDPAQPDCRMTNGVTAFEVDRDNVMWLSPYHEKGLMKIVIENARPDVFLLSDDSGKIHSNDIRALRMDSSNSLWVGTKNGKLYCYDSEYELQRFYSCADDGTPLGRIYTIFEDSLHNIWLGTKGNGLWRMTPDADGYKFKQYRYDEGDIGSLSDDHVYSIDQDYSGRLWIATYEGGINMLPDSNSDYFINIRNSFPNYPHEQGKRVRYILCDTPDRMLVATTEGLITLNPSVSPENMKFPIFQHSSGNKNSLGCNDIIHILKDTKGRVWLSTFGGGLSLIKGYSDSDAPVFVNYTTSNGLPGNIVLSSTEDPKGNIWVSTEKGVASLQPESNVITSYVQWDYFSPISYSEAAAATDSRGSILFGGMNKLHKIDPCNTQLSKYDYRLSFIGFEIQNQEAVIGDDAPLSTAISEKGTVSLPFDYLLFRIEFASLNFRLQNRVNYMYYLEGYDDDWTISRDVNSVYYSKVPHGNYVFHVKAFVGNETMSSPEIVLRINIAAPPWLSWYAYGLYTIVLILVLWIIWRTLYTMTKLRTEAKVEQHMSEMKIKFFTNISHELRTPLTLIMGGLEDIQKRETLSKRGNDSLNMSYKNSRRMLQLINQLLDFRKIVKDKIVLRIRHTDIVSIAKSVLSDYRDMADERKIVLLFTVSHNSIPLWIDAERIESVFYNLLSNALKFTPDNGTISMSVLWREGEDCVLISVTDSGVGISKEHQNQIFARFSQFNNSLRGDVPGSGIGLALCKEIVELHHGVIEVESKADKGTTFTIKLLTGNLHFNMEQIDFNVALDDKKELVCLESRDLSSEQSLVMPPEDAPIILLVDDNAEIRRFIYNNLIENYRVIEATDGLDALEKISKEQPNIIVTDLIMPRMDGIELVDKIRHNFEISHIPIIMLTAKQTPEDRLMAMKYGADGYITKPFGTELLLVRIDNLLTQRRLLFEHFSSQSANNHIGKFIAKEDVVVTNRDQEFMSELMKWIDTNIHNTEMTINDLANHMHLGRTTMYNKVKSLTGKSPIELIKEYRVMKAEILLKTGQFTVSEIAYKFGFSDPGYFSRCFKELYKVAPTDYLKMHSLQNKDKND